MKLNSNVKWASISLGLILLVLSLLLFFRQAFSGTFSSGAFHTLNLSDFTSLAPVPNIVHFVHLVEDPTDTSFDFPFRQFVAIYSAWYYLRPEQIYVHTNVEEGLIEETLQKSQNPYTKAVAALPSVSFRHAIPPNHTTSGAAITKLPNQSDFVRTKVLSELGGIYLDDDSYVLRDLKPLRETGFKNIVGFQKNGRKRYMESSEPTLLSFLRFRTWLKFTHRDLSCRHTIAAWKQVNGGIPQIARFALP